MVNNRPTQNASPCDLSSSFDECSCSVWLSQPSRARGDVTDAFFSTQRRRARREPQPIVPKAVSQQWVPILCASQCKRKASAQPSTRGDDDRSAGLQVANDRTRIISDTTAPTTSTQQANKAYLSSLSRPPPSQLSPHVWCWHGGSAAPTRAAW